MFVSIPCILNEILSCCSHPWHTKSSNIRIFIQHIDIVSKINKHIANIFENSTENTTNPPHSYRPGPGLLYSPYGSVPTLFDRMVTRLAKTRHIYRPGPDFIALLSYNMCKEPHFCIRVAVLCCTVRSRTIDTLKGKEVWGLGCQHICPIVFASFAAPLLFLGQMD